MAERLIRLPEVMARTGIKRSTVYKYMDDGRFPKSIKQSPRVAVWKESEIDAYIAKIGGGK